MEFFNNSLLVWVVIAAVGLLILRFVLNVTKKLLTLGILVGIAVAVYLFITQYLFPASTGLP
jgi:hypothetical protein